MRERERVAESATRSKPVTSQEIDRLERLAADLGEGDDVTSTTRGQHVLETVQAFLDEVAGPATDAQENGDG